MSKKINIDEESISIEKDGKKIKFGKNGENLELKIDDSKLENSEELEIKIDTLKTENDELKSEIEVLKSEIEFQKQIRNADIANLTKKRNEQEAHVKKFAHSNLASDLVRPFELLKKVVEAPSSVPEVQNYLIGFNMVVNQIQTVLENNGIKVMETKVGDEFDSNLHEANEVVDSEDFASNKIVEVLSDGYIIHDRVLIHAIVKVSK